jgi:hypothetical protein
MTKKSYTRLIQSVGKFINNFGLLVAVCILFIGVIVNTEIKLPMSDKVEATHNDTEHHRSTAAYLLQYGEVIRISDGVLIVRSTNFSARRTFLLRHDFANEDKNDLSHVKVIQIVSEKDF